MYAKSILLLRFNYIIRASICFTFEINFKVCRETRARLGEVSLRSYHVFKKKQNLLKSFKKLIFISYKQKFFEK